WGVRVDDGVRARTRVAGRDREPHLLRNVRDPVQPGGEEHGLVTGGVLHHLVAAAADRVPERTAVADRGRSLTYAELDAVSNRLAHLLVDHGVREGDRVGLFLDKSIESL